MPTPPDSTEGKVKLPHKIAHLFDWNHGTCEAFTVPSGRIYMSFVCSGCGKRSGVHCIDDVIDRELKNS